MIQRQRPLLRRSLQQQRGITLVELMIAGVLALVISYFAMSIMMTSSQTASRSNGQAQAQESGRFVLSWLHTESRRAGYNSDISADRVQPFASACAAGSAMPPAAGGNCSFNSDDPATNDRLALQRTYSTSSGNARDGQDCTGVDLSTNAALTNDETVLTDVYWIARDTGSDGDAYDDVLRCVTYDDSGVIVAPAQTIASGVEGMQLLYAEGSGSDNRAISRYVRASDISDMSQVSAVRISVLTRSWAENASGDEQRSYVLLDAAPYTFTDGVARQIMTTTVALANF